MDKFEYLKMQLYLTSMKDKIDKLDFIKIVKNNKLEHQ